MVIIILILLVSILISFAYFKSEIDALKKQNQSDSTLFAATGKQQATKSVNGQYDVISWNFTFQYLGAKSIQNINFFLENQDIPFKTVPQITPDWFYTYIWTPEDLSSSRTVIISWQGGTQSFEFEP
jgi:hypothetical protein